MLLMPFCWQFLDYLWQGDPPLLAGKSGPVSSGVTFSPWIPVCTRLWVCPPAVECFFHPSYECHGVKPLCLQSQIFWGSCNCQNPGWESAMGLRIFHSCRRTLWYNCFPVYGLPTSLYGICFYYD